MTLNFRPIQTNLDLGSNYITPNLAYFLGGLCVGDTVEINNNKYWISLVRHNPQSATPTQLETHLNNVRSIASAIGKEHSIFMNDYFQGIRSSENNRLLFSAGKKGFLTLFKEVEPYNLETFINDIRDNLTSSCDTVLKSFIIGIFDTKGSYDKTLKKIAVDVRSDNAAELIISILDILGISYNHNPQRERQGAPRSPQIRIKYIDYVTNFGYLSSQRLDHITDHLDLQNISYTTLDNTYIPFNGLRLVSF